MTDTAHARRTDPETSHDAAASVPNIRKSQELILTILSRCPQTDEEIFSHLPSGVMSPSGARTRRSELVAAGRVIDTGERRRTISNRRTIVWDLKREQAQ